MIDLIKNFHQPDRRWNLWKISTHEEFVKSFMVKGKFNCKVPSQIVDDYGVVERLICYSYYYYPLIDEAFSKATRIFESAINLRLDELDIKRAKGFESLDRKIKKIALHTSKSVVQEWDKARQLRNHFAHPEAGKYMGIVVARGFYQMVNVINLIFIDKEEIEKNENSLDDLKLQSCHLKQGLFKLQIDNDTTKNYLIWSIVPYSFYKTKTCEKSFWVFHPVLTSFPQTIENLVFSPPFYFCLRDIHISEDSFEAIISSSNQKLKLVPTTDFKNIDLLSKHNNVILSSDAEVKRIFWDYLESEMSFELTKFLYNECWS